MAGANAGTGAGANGSDKIGKKISGSGAGAGPGEGPGEGPGNGPGAGPGAGIGAGSLIPSKFLSSAGANVVVVVVGGGLTVHTCKVAANQQKCAYSAFLAAAANWSLGPLMSADMLPQVMLMTVRSLWPSAARRFALVASSFASSAI